MPKKTTVLVSGVFNILHPGHMRFLRFARNYGDNLIVAVEGDQHAGENAHIPENLRLEALIFLNQFIFCSLLNKQSKKYDLPRIKKNIIN